MTARGVRALLLGAFAILCVHGLVWDSPTVDEFTHLPVGWFYLKTGDFDLAARTPPLVKSLAALPLLVLDPAIDTAKPAAESAWYPWILGTDFMERNRAAYDRIFLLGRLPIVALGLLMGIVVHRWARELYGEAGGLTSLALFAFCPTIVAHAHLATVDVGAAAFMALALYLFYRYALDPTPGRLLASGVGLGLAQLAKTSGVLLYPILAVLTLIVLVRPWREGERGGIGKRLGGLAAIVLLSLLVLNAGYLFQGTGRPLGDFEFQSRFMKKISGALPGWLPMPLPAPYLEGFDGIRLDAETGEFPNYLFGRWSREGTPVYYLVTLLYKNPLPFLILALAAPFARLRPRPPGEVFVALPLAVLLVASSILTDRVNYGIRHILPVFPFLFIYMGRLAPFVLARGRAWRTAGALLLGLYPLSILQATPDTISYFNLLARGRGDEILLDSNLDWGQGLKRLRSYMDREGIDRIGLAYFGHVDPAIYGIEWGFPSPEGRGPVAVSANFLHGYPYMTYAEGRMAPVPPEAFAWIARHPRVEDLGGGIFLYRIGPPAP
ncbi:MAG TPA: glycosyltransferase family 39 protein [Thermoanaerobaculia bacterium]|nr:glycosyltransferase family 39 protein [Thermoanaerobaculia bacterium]